MDSRQLRRRVRVAAKEEPGDLLLTDGRVANVFTRRIEPENIVIAGGWIADFERPKATARAFESYDGPSPSHGALAARDAYRGAHRTPI